MANTEWWQRGPVDGVPAVLQPIAHILLQVGETVDELIVDLNESQWNARPAGVASPAFHVRHMAGVIDRLFTYARGNALSPEQIAAMRSEGDELAPADVAKTLAALHARVDAAVAELRTIDVTTLGDFRGVGRAKLPSTVIGCLVHGAEHAMRHVGQLSVTTRIVRPGERVGVERTQPESFRARALTASLTVKDIHASLAWYRDVIGFTVARQHERDGTLRAVSLKAGAVQLLIGQDDGAKGANRVKGQGFSLQLTTTQDVDELARRIKANGVTLDSEPADSRWGARLFRVKDPDGFTLVITHEK
jgi:uncharacterized glyoxalase superfamily protein PhnB